MNRRDCGAWRTPYDLRFCCALALVSLLVLHGPLPRTSFLFISQILVRSSFRTSADPVCLHTCAFAPSVVSVRRIYKFLFKVTKRSSTGLLAAAFTAIVPSYISRSVGGSYDNEGVAIFALVFVFYLWIKSVNTGSMMWSCLTVSGRCIRSLARFG